MGIDGGSPYDAGDISPERRRKMEVKIIRTQVVVVADKEENQYGDTIFHDVEGNEYKLGNKRAHLSDQIVVGRATELGWAHFNNDYIATAKLVEGELPESTKPPIPESAKPHVVKYIDSETAKIRSICVAYAKDAWIADKIEYKQIYACADMFLKYVRNEEVN